MVLVYPPSREVGLEHEFVMREDSRPRHYEHRRNASVLIGNTRGFRLSVAARDFSTFMTGARQTWGIMSGILVFKRGRDTRFYFATNIAQEFPGSERPRI